MKKSRNLLIFSLFVFAMMLLFHVTEVSAKKAPIISATVVYNKETNSLTIMEKNKVIDTCLYKKETLYVKKDFRLVRLGPGKGFTKSDRLPKYIGDKIVRIGVTSNGKYSIVKKNKRFYFVLNSNLTKKKPASNITPMRYTSSQFKTRGVIHWGGWRWTWYSQRVMPGRGLRIPGRHVVGRYVCDRNGYICLASGRLRRGTVVRTPFGRKGKVYDSGCARNTLDVYTNF
ncbi:MAG: hypothetical protein Q4E53_12895 [Eubacteriales bacterium]|nr:hypothetical protein [Eubacteriales bacterium]